MVLLLGRRERQLPRGLFKLLDLAQRLHLPGVAGRLVPDRGQNRRHRRGRLFAILLPRARGCLRGACFGRGLLPLHAGVRAGVRACFGRGPCAEGGHEVRQRRRLRGGRDPLQGAAQQLS